MIKPIPIIDAAIPVVLSAIQFVYLFIAGWTWARMSRDMQAKWDEFVEEGRSIGTIPDDVQPTRPMKMHLFNAYIIAMFSLTWPVMALLGGKAGAVSKGDD